VEQETVDYMVELNVDVNTVTAPVEVQAHQYMQQLGTNVDKHITRMYS